MAVTMPAESLKPQRAAQPLTERILPRSRLRWLVIAAWSAVPFVRLAIFAALIAGAGVIEAPIDYIRLHIPGAIVNFYVLVIVLVGIRPVTDRLMQVAALGNEQTQRVARLAGSTVGPLAILLALVAVGQASVITEFGAQALVSQPVPFLIEAVFAVLIRLPQATALWISVIALATVAELGRHPVPGTFPEDRSLGLRKVGTMLTTILTLYVAVLIPAFLFATSHVADFLTVLAVAAVALGAMVIALWQIHGRMVAERSREVGLATARYAAAYRRAASDHGPENGSELQAAQLLLDGAKTIHEWPFDDRTERIAGLLLTSVLAGVIVRLVLIGLGF